MLAHRREPWLEELRVDAFDGVEPKAVHAGRLGVPNPPIGQFLDDFGFVDIDIVTHDVVEIAALLAHIAAPLFAVEAHDAGAAVVGGVVGAGEVTPVPAERRIRAVAFGEIVDGVERTFDRRVVAHGTVVDVDDVRNDAFLTVGAHPVVEDDVGEDAQAVRAQCADRAQIVAARPVFRRYRAFRVEFAEIVHVIDAVADVCVTRLSFVRRRQPCHRESGGGEVLRLRRNPIPQPVVVRQIPFEALQHRLVVCCASRHIRLSIHWYLCMLHRVPC